LTPRKRAKPQRGSGRSRGESSEIDEAGAYDDGLDPPAPEGEPARHPITFAPEALDPDTLKIVRRLQRYGHQAYLVGGCVRDLLLERTPKDFDVATSARPRQIKRLFRNCRIIGRRFKLAHIHFGEKIIEVSTFRRNPQDDEANGGNGDEEDLLIRRDNVYGNAEEDAVRRDFTINALFYDVGQGEVLDYVGGMDDIERRRLDTIGVPDIRFREDPVRILRAAEFSARLDFTIDDAVAEAMESCGPEIERAAKPRVLEEILQALSCGRSEAVFRTLVELGILDHVIPEIGDMQEVDTFLNDLRAVDQEDGGRRTFSDALLLTFLFRMRIEEEEALYEADDAGPPINPLEPLEKIFGPFSERMGVSRRNSQRLREIHLGLRKIDGRRKRRRINPAVLVRRAHFPETLTAYKVICLAENRPLKNYETWKDRLDRTRAEDQRRSPRAKRARGHRRGGSSTTRTRR